MTHLRYHPVLGDAEQLVRERAPARLLVVGDEVPDSIGDAGEARRLPTAPVSLPTGSYLFALDDGIAILIVTEGAAPGAPLHADWSAPEDHPLINAFGWFSEWWDLAHEIPRPAFSVGDEVVTVPAGQEATIRDRSFEGGSWFYRVRVENRTVTMRESVLRAPVIDDDPRSWVTREPAPAARFAATLTRAKLREHLTDTIYSFRATRTLFRPYQFRPVMRLLASGSLRLLIADEVGLGKTIEAGLVWTELDARNQASRVLVVCPSMLVPKWRAEMDERFGYDLLELTREHLDDLVTRIETDRLSTRYHAVCSLERLRVWPGLERLAEVGARFDLIIVDEAHAFRNSGTKSNALGALLSDWADALVFLSATPLNLGNDDLYNLLELLAPGEFDDRHVLEQRLQPNGVLNRIAASFFERDTTNVSRRRLLLSIAAYAFGPSITSRVEYDELDALLQLPVLEPAQIAEAKRLIARLHTLSAVVSRTRKVEIQEHKAVREAIPIAVQWTPAEREFYSAFESWQKDRAVKLGLPVGFVTQMPLRLASSCLPAARDRVIEWHPRDWTDEDLDVDADADLEEGADGSEPDDDSRDVEIPPPSELVDLARRLGNVDTKYDAFLQALLPIVHAGKRVLVFTFSRAAIAYLEPRLREVVRLAVLHGGINKDERHEIMQQFRAHEFDVLLASRVASEGIDLEFCSAVVNYDLPWNPMEVEQRIGRIDRFGQTEDKVLVLNFHTPGTIETDIIERVLLRIGVFSESIGELEPILQSRLSELRRTMFDFSLTDDQRQRRLDEMLTALEERRMTQDDVESATAYLSSTDQAEIEGFESDLVSSGRYVGQVELLELIDDWSRSAQGGGARISSDGRRLTVRGNSQMESHLRGVQRTGERSNGEIEGLARALRDEQPITMCLDQELARVTGEALLSSIHPLTRAALRVPGASQARFAHVAMPGAGVDQGEYLVLIAIARWNGIRPTTEFWTSAVALDSYGDAPGGVGAGVLAALARAELTEAVPASSVDLKRALERAQRQLFRRQAEEEARRTSENESLTQTRRISLRETHDRKVGQIRRRIDTLRKDGNVKVIRLHEAQLGNQERLLREAEGNLDAMSVGSMDVEYIASCIAVVGPT